MRRPRQRPPPVLEKHLSWPNDITRGQARSQILKLGGAAIGKSGNRDRLKRGLLAIVALVSIGLLGWAAARAPVFPDVQVTIEQFEDGNIRVTYEMRRRRASLILSELPSGYRERRWSVETPGFSLINLDADDEIVRDDGKRFDRVVIYAEPDPVRMHKEYQPLSQYGDGGVLLYTGHFWPMTGRGGRMYATFNFRPARGGEVVAFGDRAPALVNWRSPMAHPAFVYLGPIKPVETQDVMAIVDPDAPQWIIDEFYALTPQAFEWLAGAFGFSFDTKPNLFLAAPLGPQAWRLSYAGDALPAQFQITLEGGAWEKQSLQAVNLFRRSTIHEAVHLWQSAARPGVDEDSPWIHEGSADAIAAEALVALGLWQAADKEADFERAKSECAKELYHGSLASAVTRGRFRGIYACGHVIAEAVARAEGASVSAFWRDFVPLAIENDGYTAALFFKAVHDRTGDYAFADRVRQFVQMPVASPDREIERLLGGDPGLARAGGR